MIKKILATLARNKKEIGDCRMYTKKDIIRMVEEEDVEFIRLQFTDIFGTLKNIAVPKASWKKRWKMNVCLTALL